MSATVLILTKLPGFLPVKTRLAALLGEEGARRAYVAMLEDTLRLARRFDPEPVVAYSPPDADPHVALPAWGPVRLRPVAGTDGATCLENAIIDAWEERPLVVLGGDAPDLPPSRVKDALRRAEAADAVFVPTGDGGFSCLVLARPLPDLAAAFAFGAGDALAQIETTLARAGAVTRRTDPWPDVDTPEQYRAWQRRRLGSVCE